MGNEEEDEEGGVGKIGKKEDVCMVDSERNKMEKDSGREELFSGGSRMAKIGRRRGGACRWNW